MERRRSQNSSAAPTACARFSFDGSHAEKKTPASLLEEIDRLFAQCKTAFVTEQLWERGRTLLISQLLCLGRHTITGVLSTAGEQFNDWSAWYRIFSHRRCDCDPIFSVLSSGVADHGASSDPFVTGMDDSLLRKTGKNIPGVHYFRDPLSPPFHVNFVRGQRVLQISAAIPTTDGDARMIPVDFIDAPSAPKPGKHATQAEQEQYAQEKKHRNINTYGRARMAHIRSTLDGIDPNRILWMQVDGRFTNASILKHLPERTVLTGRIRSDATLYYPVSAGDARAVGRRRKYGERAPTPEQIRIDPSIPWQPIEAFAAGKRHVFKIKVIGPVLWRSAGANTLLRLIVIAPLGYRLTKRGKLLYRQPAYLICTDLFSEIAIVLQQFLWRWDVEVNFRDEKQIIGAGEAQVRSKASVQLAPAFAVAAYSFMLLAGINAFGSNAMPDGLPHPKWRREKKRRPTTQDLQKQLRMELWADSLNEMDFSGLSVGQGVTEKPEKFKPFPISSVFYATA